MSRGRQYIQFEGYFAENVLGIFRVIRGFADLRDLAAVSVPYEMTEHDTQACRVVGHQRELNEKHALDIKKYLEQSDSRFLPEVVLSYWLPGGEVRLSDDLIRDMGYPSRIYKEGAYK